MFRRFNLQFRVGGWREASATPAVWLSNDMRRALRENDPELDELMLDGSSVEVRVLQAILDSLRMNRQVSTLTLRHASVAVSIELASAVKTSQVRHLSIENTNDSSGLLISALSVALFYNRGIRSLTLRDIVLSPCSSSLGFLVESSNLTELHVCHVSPAISAQTALSLAQGLRGNSFLKVLDLTGSGMTEDAVRELAKGMQHNTTLEFLSLDFNSFGDTGVEFLSSMLTTNRHLRELHMFGNRVTCAGAEYLSRALRRNDGLESLMLSFNRIGDRGAVALAEALTENTTLHNLWFPSNSIGLEGLEAFARYLPKMDGLEQLDVGLVLDCQSEEALTMGLKNNLRLSVLHLEKPVYGEFDGDDEGALNTDMSFYLRLNRSGRRLIRTGASPSLWATILARASRHARDVEGQMIPDVLFYFLREIPGMLERRTTL